MKVLAPKHREPTPSLFSEDVLSVEGKIKRLKALVEHLEVEVFRPQPSAKLVEMYLRAIRELQDMQQLQVKETEATVDEIIERITTRNRFVLDANDAANTDSSGEIPLVGRG